MVTAEASKMDVWLNDHGALVDHPDVATPPSKDFYHLFVTRNEVRYFLFPSLTFCIELEFWNKLLLILRDVYEVALPIFEGGSGHRHVFNDMRCKRCDIVSTPMF